MPSIVLPVYYQVSKKKKVLLGMNWYRNAHFRSQSAMKLYMSELCVMALKGHVPLTGTYGVKYVYFYKRSNSDLTNVCSLSSKIFNDVLQDEGLVVNDTVIWCIEERFIVGKKDTINPRVEITYGNYKTKTNNN